MIGLGLNGEGGAIAGELNPHFPVYFDPAVSPGQVFADGAGVVLAQADGAAVTMLAADGSGIVRTMADGAAVTNLAADGAGIVRTSANGSES